MGKLKLIKVSSKGYSLIYIVLLLISSSFVASGQIDTTGVGRLFNMDLLDLMNQKVITASKYSQNSSEAPSSIGVITAEEIKQFGYRTLGEALNSQRGMYLSNDKNYIYVGSRGFSRPTDYNNRIVVMIDGHILNEIVYGSSLMGNELGINLDNIERIEIIRGPGASVYGSGSMLNTINLILKKGADINGITISAGTGSFGKRDLSAIWGKKIKNTDISVAGTGGTYKGENYYFPELDSPETNYGISRGNDWEKYMGVQAAVTNGNLKFSSGFSSRIKGIPTGAFNSVLASDVESTDKRFYAETTYRKDLYVSGSLLFRLFYDNYIYSGSYPTITGASFDASTGQWGGAEVQYYLEAGNRNTITAGFEYKYCYRNDYREWDTDTTFFSHNHPFSFFSIYAQDQIKIAKNLSLTAGLRYDQYSEFGHSASPRLAAVYRYSAASSLKLLFSEAFRIPNFYESYYESVNNHKANTDIRPERIRATEIAWSHNITTSLYGNFSVYRFTTYNLIDQVMDEADGMTEFRNIGKATGTGLEYEVKYKHRTNKNQGFINFTIQRTIDNNTNVTLSNSPEFMIKSGYAFNVAKYVNLVPEFYYESGRKTLKGNNTNDVYLFNIGINSVRFLKFFEASLKMKNIFNIKYYAPAGNEFVQDILIQDSRNIYFKLTAHF